MNNESPLTKPQSSHPQVADQPGEVLLNFFYSIVQSSDDAIISKSIDGKVTSWNSGAQSIFGYTEQEMLGKSMLVLFPPEKIYEEDLILQKVTHGIKVDHFETERLHKNGNRINVSVSVSPIFDKNGQVVGISKIARDITLKVKMEATNRLANAILQSTDDAVIGKSLSGIVTSWNPGATKMYGYTADEMLGKSIQILLPEDRKAEEQFILDKIRQGETVDHFETVRVCKNGEQKNISVTISPILNSFGQIVGASKIARDITQQKIAEAKLRLDAQVFTNTGEGILIVDSNGLIVDVNHAFSRISGYAREEVLGKNPEEFRSGRQDPSVFRRMRRSVMRYGEWKGEIWSRRKDGAAYSVMVTISCARELSGEVKNYVILMADITPIKLQQEQLEFGAHFDALTKLPNRLLLADRLQQAMANSKRQGQVLVVLYLDIDGFKEINDLYGHDAGDELLITLAGQMRASLREADTLARMGGDEFVAVLADLHTIEDCIELISRLLNACSKPIRIGAGEMHVTASIGATIYLNDNVDADQLMRQADHAMYEAKHAGKNRFFFFDAALDAEHAKLNSEQQRIGMALRNGEFVLHFQPKVNMRSGAVIGAEALIRWNHPQRGLLYPAAFLPLIEGHPLCEDIGAWVLASAIEQIGAWKQQGLHLPVSINMAARQFQNAQFVMDLISILKRNPDVDPGSVELEILETSALENVPMVQNIMDECHQLGVHFSLDDFGTGYSSLTYLKRLQVSTIKIDQSFIRTMLDDSNDMAIVKGVIGLANAFNRKVIAEGVETNAHGRQLLALGCELGQGYAIARPMPADQIADWVAHWRPPEGWH